MKRKQALQVVFKVINYVYVLETESRLLCIISSQCDVREAKSSPQSVSVFDI